MKRTEKYGNKKRQHKVRNVEYERRAEEKREAESNGGGEGDDQNLSRIAKNRRNFSKSL